MNSRRRLEVGLGVKFWCFLADDFLVGGVDLVAWSLGSGGVIFWWGFVDFEEG